MKINKHHDMTPFDMSAKPSRPSLLFMPLIWAAAYLSTRGNQFRINKVGMEKMKPPYLVLSMHQGFMDYSITPLTLFPHRASYVSDMEGFANYGKWLYAKLGCIGTRRFTSNPVLIHNIRHVVKENKDIIVIFPEARHSNVGTGSKLPASIGKLIKLLKIPVVVQKLNGSYLNQPIWDEKHRRKSPINVRFEKILDTSEIMQMSIGQITDLVNKHFIYDEYQWQYDNQIRIDYPKRAEGLHKVLYLCPHCKADNKMQSRDDTISCNACHRSWRMDEFGRLSSDNTESGFVHIPDWYEFQRMQVQNEIKEGHYQLKAEVSIDALPNEKGFVSLGQGILQHTMQGFLLSVYNSGEQLFFAAKAMNSVHTEYDYREKGDCVVLSTKDCCYYLYNSSGNLPVTKIQLAAEVLYEKYCN